MSQLVSKSEIYALYIFAGEDIGFIHANTRFQELAMKKSLANGSVPLAILGSCTTSEQHGSKKSDRATHRPNEKEISHGRASWQTL